MNRALIACLLVGCAAPAEEAPAPAEHLPLPDLSDVDWALAFEQGLQELLSIDTAGAWAAHAEALTLRQPGCPDLWASAPEGTADLDADLGWADLCRADGLDWTGFLFWDGSLSAAGADTIVGQRRLVGDARIADLDGVPRFAFTGEAEGAFTQTPDSWSRSSTVAATAHGSVAAPLGASAVTAWRADLYLFVSSISVYATPVPIACTDGAPLATMEDPTDEEVMANYGALKVLCEERVRSAFGEQALVVRPGLIVGPGDYTDRFTSWVWLAAHAAELDGSLPAPGSPDDRTQLIDVRDLTRWMVRCCEEGLTGTVHATGPHERCTMEDLVEACLVGTDAAATPVWLPAAFLETLEVAPWAELPCWLPAGHEQAGMLATDLTRARAMGLACRPLVDTARDTLAWIREDLERREDKQLRAGLTVERARELLEAWAARS